LGQKREGHVANDKRTTVDFYFDPTCPWAWRTSLWIREVRKVRPIDVRWKFLSLEEINREAGTLKENHPKSRGPFRTMVLARRLGGEDAVDRLYLELGSARHERKEDFGDPATTRNALKAVGLSESLYDEAMSDQSTADEYLAEHKAVAERGGFGVASLVIDDGDPIFGPVIIPVPEGEEAGVLYDHVAALSKLPYFYELKRNR
jgi:2-hydroxychromene-2-carboxylate isomerase